MIQSLQKPVGFKDAYVRQVPDYGAKAEAGTFAQITFARQIEKRERLCARTLHLISNRFR